MKRSWNRPTPQGNPVVWIPRHGFRISRTGFRMPCHWNLDSGFQSLVRLRILWAVFRIPKLRIPDSTRQAKIFRIPKSGFLYMGRTKTWASADLVFVDCQQSLFFSDLVRRVHARANGERREKWARQPEKEKKWTSFVSRLQSRAWSFACLARFDRWNKKKGRLLVVYCFRDAGITWEPSKGYPDGGKNEF